MRFPALFALLLCVGCVRSTEARAERWWAVSSEHVRLRGDVPPQRAVDYTLRLEVVHRALARVFPGCGREGEVTTDVVVLRRDGDYRAIAPEGSAGFFSSGGASLVAAPARMVVPTGRREDRRLTHVFVHELTHRFVAACYPDAPTWLHEGLAAYFETLRFRDTEIVVGTATYQFIDGTEISAFHDTGGSLVLQLPRDRVPRPSQVVAMTPASFYHRGGRSISSDHTVLSYGGAWTLVHAMMLGPDAALREQLRAYLARIELGREDTPLALPQAIDLDRLDAAIEPYFHGAALRVRRVPYDWPPIAEPIARPMPLAEAHLLWAELHTRSASQASLERARQHLDLAERSPESAPRALLLRASIAPRDELESAIERARRLAPDDLDVIRAWAIVTLKHGDESARMRAVMMLAPRADLRAVDRVVLAELALALHDPPFAIEQGCAAVAESPELVETHFVLGRALLASGRIDDARRELEIVTHVASRRPALAADALSLLASLPRD